MEHHGCCEFVKMKKSDVRAVRDDYPTAQMSTRRQKILKPFMFFGCFREGMKDT